MPLFSSPKAPAPPPTVMAPVQAAAMVPPPPPAANPATAATPNVVASGVNARARGAAGSAAGGLNPTGSQGLTAPPSTAGNKLLGE